MFKLTNNNTYDVSQAIYQSVVTSFHVCCLSSSQSARLVRFVHCFDIRYVRRNDGCPKCQLTSGVPVAETRCIAAPDSVSNFLTQIGLISLWADW